MARRRYISTDISTDSKVNAVSDLAALLYTWSIPHFADNCRLTPRNAAECRWTILPGRKSTEKDVEKAMNELFCVGLWGRDEDGRIFIPSDSFYKFQTYINAANRRETPQIAASSSPSLSPSPSLKEDTYVGELISLYHSIMVKLPRVREATAGRREKIRARLKEHPEMDYWRSVFEKAAESSFLNGGGGSGWKASLDWFIHNPENAIKVLEGKYDGAKSREQINSEVKEEFLRRHANDSE